MKEFKIGNVYRRKGFHYKVLDERPLDDTFTQYLLVASFCSDCGELYQFDIPTSCFNASHQRRRCDECKKIGVKAKPWPEAEINLRGLLVQRAFMRAKMTNS